MKNEISYSRAFRIICKVCHRSTCSFNPDLNDRVDIRPRYLSQHSGTKVLADDGKIYDEALVYENGYVEFRNNE